MANELEIRERQKEKLYVLLELQALNPDTDINGLKQAINRAKVSMLKEDISDVVSAIAEIY